jgi:hypothetical protein
MSPKRRGRNVGPRTYAPKLMSLNLVNFHHATAAIAAVWLGKLHIIIGFSGLQTCVCLDLLA